MGPGLSVTLGEAAVGRGGHQSCGIGAWYWRPSDHCKMMVVRHRDLLKAGSCHNSEVENGSLETWRQTMDSIVISHGAGKQRMLSSDVLGVWAASASFAT